MEKAVQFDGYNMASVKKINPDGSVTCDLKTTLNGLVVKEDRDISFDYGHWPFDLTPEEISELGN